VQAGTQSLLGHEPEAYRVSAGAKSLQGLADPIAKCQANLYSASRVHGIKIKKKMV
jgi:hypothetical protein